MEGVIPLAEDSSGWRRGEGRRGGGITQQRREMLQRERLRCFKVQNLQNCARREIPHEASAGRLMSAAS